MAAMSISSTARPGLVHRQANDAKALATLQRNAAAPRLAFMAAPLASQAVRPTSLFAHAGAPTGPAQSFGSSLQKAKGVLSDLRETLRSAERAMAERGPVEFHAEHGTQTRYVARDTFGERDVLETRYLHETRDVYETRNIYETQPVYEQQPVYETIVTGSRTLTGFNRFSDAGLGVGSDFQVQVGSGAVAKIKFASNTKVTVTIGSATQEFQFGNSGGQWRAALVAALNTIDGLTATVNTAGALELQTDSAQSLTLSEVPNGFLDFSPTALDKLGLSAGMHEAGIVGYEQVQVGTEEVVVGTEEVLVGTEQVIVGSEQVVVGRETVRTGSEQVQDGMESVLIGFARVHAPPRLDAVRERLASLTSALKNIDSDPRAAAAAPASDPNGQMHGVADVLRSLDPVVLNDVASPAAVRRSLRQVDAALGQVEALAVQLSVASAKVLAPLNGGVGLLAQTDAQDASPAAWLAQASQTWRRAEQSRGLTYTPRITVSA
ncbi:MAG TPA: hypothetical protein VHG27_00375 [Xanthobacteraceae bacterium]|nr:hypothetical protein [Xanthobacteraceae bacterium]